MADIKIDYEAMIENFCWIVPKNRKPMLLKMNDAQKEVYDVIAKRKAQGKRCYILILKARQLGMSTFTEALGCSMCVTKDNQSMVIMTHEEKASQNLYRMTHYYYENYPDELKKLTRVVKDNQALMSFTNGSTIQTMVASDNSKGAGRSQTITYAHLSEYAFWGGNAPELLAGLLSACTDDAIVIIESTANGYNDFKKKWDQAVEDKLKGDDDGWIPLFFPWYGDPQYRAAYNGFELTSEEERMKEKFGLDNEQLAWRRWKIKTTFSGDVNLFKQEFPSCVTYETRVGTDKGLLKIGEIQGYYETAYGTIKKYIENPVREIYKLKTYDGYELRGTYEHPIFVNDKDCVDLGSLKENDVIQLSKPMLAKDYYTLEWIELGVSS